MTHVNQQAIPPSSLPSSNPPPCMRPASPHADLSREMPDAFSFHLIPNLISSLSFPPPFPIYLEPLPPDSPFWGLSNVLLSPHNMDMTTTFMNESVRFFTENCGRFVKGGALRNLVDKKAGY